MGLYYLLCLTLTVQFQVLPGGVECHNIRCVAHIEMLVFSFGHSLNSL